jgi:hypothetical protein
MVWMISTEGDSDLVVGGYLPKEDFERGCGHAFEVEFVSLRNNPSLPKRRRRSRPAAEAAHYQPVAGEMESSGASVNFSWVQSDLSAAISKRIHFRRTTLLADIVAFSVTSTLFPGKESSAVKTTLAFWDLYLLVNDLLPFPSQKKTGCYRPKIPERFLFGITGVKSVFSMSESRNGRDVAHGHYY